MNKALATVFFVAAMAVWPVGRVALTQEKSPTDPIARLGDQQLTAADLEKLVAPRLGKLRAEEYRLRRMAIDEWIVNTLLANEASARSMSVEALLKTEVDDRVPTLTDAETQAIIESSPERFRAIPPAEKVAFVKRDLHLRRTALRRQEFLRSLRGAERAEVFLDPPRIHVSEAGFPSKGPLGAPVSIVVFADFECPYCARLNPLLDAVVAKYPSDVRVVYRHFPVGGRGVSVKAAEAAACAAQQNRFWQLHDQLYANQARLQPESLRPHAEAVGLDMAAFDACVVSDAATAAWRRDKSDGDAYGVNGTPTLFVNGRMLPGLVPLETLTQVIDEEMAARAKEGGR